MSTTLEDRGIASEATDLLLALRSYLEPAERNPEVCGFIRGVDIGISTLREWDERPPEEVDQELSERSARLRRDTDYIDACARGIALAAFLSRSLRMLGVAPATAPED